MNEHEASNTQKHETDASTPSATDQQQHYAEKYLAAAKDRYRKANAWIRERNESEWSLALTCILALFTGLQWRATVNSNRISERAWLTVQNANFENYENIDAFIVGNVTLQNTGRSPALEMHGIGQIIVGPFDLPRGEMPPINVPNPPSVSVIGPNATVTSTIQKESRTTALDIASLRAGSSFAYSYGVVDYRDIFGYRHTTHYCLYLVGSKDQPFRVRWCQQWNDAN